VDAALREVVDELADFGRENDARETARERRMLNVTPETGRLLAILVQATRARRILEVGTSNGYSTIWLAWAARETDGQIETLERDANKIAMARANLERAGLADRVTIHGGVALETLARLSGPYDFVFLDADRPNYLAYAGALLPLLRPGGLLVTDNVVSHAAELPEFLARIKNDPSWESVTVPVGNGEEITYKK
jgi:predicted O-methyltransferase YrrM